MWVLVTSLQELQGCRCLVLAPALHFSPLSGPPTAPPAELRVQYPPPTSLDTRVGGERHHNTWRKPQRPPYRPLPGGPGLTVFVDDFLDLFIEVLPTFDQGLGPALPNTVEIFLLEREETRISASWPGEAE